MIYSKTFQEVFAKQQSSKGSFQVAEVFAKVALYSLFCLSWYKMCFLAYSTAQLLLARLVDILDVIMFMSLT